MHKRLAALHSGPWQDALLWPWIGSGHIPAGCPRRELPQIGCKPPATGVSQVLAHPATLQISREKMLWQQSPSGLVVKRDHRACCELTDSANTSHSCPSFCSILTSRLSHGVWLYVSLPFASTLAALLLSQCAAEEVLHRPCHPHVHKCKHKWSRANCKLVLSMHKRNVPCWVSYL